MILSGWDLPKEPRKGNLVSCEWASVIPNIACKNKIFILWCCCSGFLFALFSPCQSLLATIKCSCSYLYKLFSCPPPHCFITPHCFFCFNSVPCLEVEWEEGKANFLICSEWLFSFGSHTQLVRMGNYVCMGVLLHPCMANGILMLFKLFIWRKGEKIPSQRSVSFSSLRSFSSFEWWPVKIAAEIAFKHFHVLDEDEEDQAGILVWIFFQCW